MAARIRFLTREGCHLCEEARRVLDGVRASTGESVETVDVDRDLDAAARAAVTDLVPVVEIDGAEVARWRVDAARVLAALRH